MSSIGIDLVIKQSPRPLGMEGCALDCFKKRMLDILACICQDEFRMCIAFCVCDYCKTVKMRVGSHLDPYLRFC